MQPVSIGCRAPEGLDAPAVSVEVHLGPGLPGLIMVGLAETAVRESRDRVRAAILNSGLEMPDRRIVVSLAPAEIPKAGSGFDLAIAIGILCASGQLPKAGLANTEFIGELALSGELRTVTASLPMALAAVRAGHRLVVPQASAAETGLLRDARVLGAAALAEVCAFLRGETTLLPIPAPPQSPSVNEADLAEVKGQLKARRALEIAAAGQHNLLLSGPPGTGKSMLAQRLPGILPPASAEESLESAALYSLRGFRHEQWPLPGQRPFRAPHHTASAVALVGGGSHPQPGEVSLAHNGVLFLDELPEFRREALEALREPLENGVITVARARRSVLFPARLQLIAAMNPCPCGYSGDRHHACRCSPDQLRRYREKISGPLLDRLDMQVELLREPLPASLQLAQAEGSTTVRARVTSARSQAIARSGCSNAQLRGDALRQWCRPDALGTQLLHTACQKLGLSMRSHDRVLRVARTIADLDASAEVRQHHLAEALSYRSS